MTRVKCKVQVRNVGRKMINDQSRQRSILEELNDNNHIENENH